MTFQRIYEHTIEKAPQLAPRNTHVIHEWLVQGYDVEKDIIPAIDQATKNGAKAIHSFAYFSGYIRSNNEKRIKEELKPKELTVQEQEAARAKSVALMTRKYGHCKPTDEIWLERYEQIHGRVEV